MKKWLKLFGALSLIIGAFLLFSSQTGLTGAVIGNEKAGTIGSILGLILIIGGILGMMVWSEEERIKAQSLENFLYNQSYNQQIPIFNSVEEGIKKLGKGLFFGVENKQQGVSYFIYTESKKEAADIANYLVRGRRLYEDKEAVKTFGKIGRSTNLEKLKILEEKDYIKKLRPKRIGFAKSEYDVKNGRGWVVEGLYHLPHIDKNINYPHYNVNYKPRYNKKKEIHILIKKN